MLLMFVAGIAWGIYSLRGRGVQRPLATTADNFLRTLPVARASGSVSFIRFSTRRNVLLPQPDGPMSAVT